MFFFLLVIILILTKASYAQYLETVIPVGSFPRAFGYNSTNYKVYCANSGDNTVTIINTQNNQVITTIRVGTYPCAFAYNSASNKIYCANQQSNEVSIINGATNEVINTVTVGLRPTSLLFNSTNNKVYCANSSGNSVSVIGGGNDNVVATINVGGFPTCLTLNSTNNKIYSANTDGNTVTIIDCVTDQVISTVPVGISPSSIAYDPDNNEIYCSSWANGRIHMINGSTNQLVDSIIYGNAGPQSLIKYSFYNRIFYANFTGDNIKVIDGGSDSVIGTSQFLVGERPYTIIPTYAGIYCANLGSNSIVVIDPFYGNFIIRINVGYPVALISSSIRVYVANLFSSNVSVIRQNLIGLEENNTRIDSEEIFKIYPNPTKSYFTIRSPQITNNASLKLFDITGKLIKEVKVTRPEMLIPLNGIKPGIYFIEVGTIRKKLIVST